MSAPQRPVRVRGPYEDRLWSFVADDELRLPQDAKTGRLIFPPAAVAPGTLDPPACWRRLAGSGELVAWTVFRRSYFPEIPIPYTVVVVRSAEGPLFVGHLDGDHGGRLRHGSPMRLVFEDVDQGSETTRIFNWVTVEDHPPAPTDREGA